MNTVLNGLTSRALCCDAKCLGETLQIGLMPIGSYHEEASIIKRRGTNDPLINGIQSTLDEPRTKLGFKTSRQPTLTI